MSYELISISPEYDYSDTWETVFVCSLRRQDGIEGDCWIVAGVPRQHQDSARAAVSVRAFEGVRVFGDSPDAWCPDCFDSSDSDEILAAVRDRALGAHRAMLSEADPGGCAMCGSHDLTERSGVDGARVWCVAGGHWAD